MPMWTDVVVQNDSCRRIVSVQFQFASKRIDHNTYRVMLVHGDDFWQRAAQQERLEGVNEVIRTSN